MRRRTVDAVSVTARHVRPEPRRLACARLGLATLSVGVLGLAAIPACATAQAQLDVHGNFARGTSTHTNSWGAGIGIQGTIAGKSSLIAISAAPSFDYLKQENGGPAQEALSLDLDLQPGGTGMVTPYVGASAGANWSSGSGKQWDGTKLGLEAAGGVQLKVGTSALSLKGEERFGYVKGQDHTLTTRFGVLISM
jgi:hypothetical protein